MPASPTLPSRPLLKSGLRRVWRDAGTLQLGIGQRHALVLHGLGRCAAVFLDRLDGTVELDALDAVAADAGLEPDIARELLRRLTVHGLLDDAAADSTALRALGPAERDRIAPDLRAWALTSPEPGAASRIHLRRRQARVDVHGAGRVGSLAAALLAHAGVGELHVHDTEPLRAGDVPAAWARAVPSEASAPPSRASLALDVCEQLAPSLRTPRRRRGPITDSERARPDVALLAPVDTLGTVDLDLRDSLVRDGVPHVPAYLRETVGVIGPFVLPGRTPCLRCLDLVRADRDPAWPHLLAQLAPAPAPSRMRRPRATGDPVDGVLATTVAAQAVLQVLCQLDGGTPSALATTIETDPHDGLTRQRNWPAHPACGCQWK